MIDLLPNPDDEAIIDSVRSYLAQELPVDRFRASGWMPGDVDRWTTVADLGWFSGPDPEIGIDIVAETLIFRELGRTLFSPAALSTALAAHIVKAAGQDRLLEEVMAGRRHVALGYPVNSADLDYDVQIIDAQPDSLVLLGNGEEIILWDPAAFTQRRELRPFDPGLRLAGASLAIGASPIARAGPDAVEIHARARVLTAAMCVGSSEAALKLAVDYAKIRTAFGRPIGAFQAVQHHCANMAVRSEAALDQVLFAALCQRENMFGAAFQVASAATVAADAAMDNAAMCIQVHGGMGFTFECEAHYHLKRAHSLKWLWGGQRALSERLLAPVSLYQAEA